VVAPVRLRPRIHDLYVARAVLVTVFATWGVLLGLDVVLGFAGEFGDIGKGGYTINHAIAATGLSVPWRAYNLFPTAAVIGALLGLGGLAASAELTALRALGLSRRRLSLSVALPLALLTLLMVANGEALAPWGDERAQALKSARNQDLVVAQFSGLWAREGGMFLNARSGEEKGAGGDRWLELRGVRLFEFADDGRLRSIANVGVAEHRPGGWVLRDVERTTFGPDSVARAKVAEEHWDSRLDEAALAASVAKPRNLGSAELRRSIDYRERNGLAAGEFEEVYWGRWFYPINVLALCLAAIPFAFGTLRSGGYGKRLFLGIVFALGFWVLQQVFTRLAGIYHFDYRVAYALPPAIMLAVSMALFRRRSG
jgi:lipopolysaccharide export system permease protein